MQVILIRNRLKKLRYPYKNIYHCFTQLLKLLKLIQLGCFTK